MIENQNHILPYLKNLERKERCFILSYPKDVSQAAIDVFTSRIRDVLIESGIESLDLYAFDKESLVIAIRRPDSLELHADFFVDKAKLEMTLDKYLDHLLIEVNQLTEWFKENESSKFELGLKNYMVKNVTFNVIGQYVIFTIIGGQINGVVNGDNTHGTSL